MPFHEHIPRPFQPIAVQTYAPNAPGLYGISNSREWIYIGESDNIQGALLAHLKDSHAFVMQRLPTGFVFELCDRAQWPARQDRLVLEYEPICNRNSKRYS